MTRIMLQVDERTTKIEKFENSLKMYGIISFKNICCKLTALVKIIHLTVNYKFLRPVSILRLPEENKKKSETAISKELSE